MDQIIADADKAGAKLILTLTDNWRTDDGLYGYVLWGGGKHPEEFFVNPAVINLYKNHQRAMANRMNTITNRMYKDEPAIFAWDLINEPRSSCDIGKPNATCDAGETAAIQVCHSAHACSIQHNEACSQCVPKQTNASAKQNLAAAVKHFTLTMAQSLRPFCLHLPMS